MEKALYAGPWVGEFGWELTSWNPYVRHMAKYYEHVTVETQPGMEYLYEFADEIIINPRKGDYDVYYGTASNTPFAPPTGTEVVNPIDFWVSHALLEFRSVTASTDVELQPKEWRKYGTENPKKVADILCAWRGKKYHKRHYFPEKEYPPDSCIELTQYFLEAGYSVACYGENDNLHVEGTLDLRGIPLQELCGVLGQAKLAVGPSSGTLHLASLCGTPHVTWYGRPVSSMDRYLYSWNPFRTPVSFLGGGLPTASHVFKHCLERMQANTETLNWVGDEPEKNSPSRIIQKLGEG